MRIFSGIQPTGRLHIGNYFGAIKNMVLLQEENEAIFAIVDLHAITSDYNPEELPQKITDTVLDFLACGINPEKSIVFLQSQVKEHTELQWLLSCFAPLGQLRRMTQFKDKARKSLALKENGPEAKSSIDYIAQNLGIAAHEVYKPGNKEKIFGELERLHKQEEIKAGLLMYPVLQAADILLYDADAVPVGDDQKQHLELTQDLARRFNHKFGDVFKSPKIIVPDQVDRIRDLKNPSRKMSKSDPRGCLFIADQPEIIKEKIKSAVTDAEKSLSDNLTKRSGVRNLVNIMNALSPISPDELAQFSGHAEFKEALSEKLIEKLAPIRTRRNELEQKPQFVKEILEQGRKKAQALASKKINQVKERMGLKEI